MTVAPTSELTTKRLRNSWIVHGTYTSARHARSSDAMTINLQKITFGEMRASGVRDVRIYCRDHRCSHHSIPRADDVRLSDIEDRFTCTA
jgi:hypothetical protein